MSSKITSFIMTLVTMLMLGIFCFLGIIVYNEVFKDDIVNKVQEFISNITISSENLIESIKTPQILESIISTQEENIVETDYSNIQVDKFFYSQLDEYSKIIYNSLEANKENLKTGIYEIDLGTQLSNLLSQENGEDLLGDCYQSAIEAFTYDNPEIFYLEYSKMYLNIETTTRGTKKTYRVMINSGDEGSYLYDEFTSKEKIDIAINEIEKIKAYFVQNKKTTTYDNIKAVHDYLIESIEYDESISESNIYNVYGALINKKCVCEGYAKAFKYLMDSLDIPCTIVIGEGINSEGNRENHAWNYVQINGIWYAIDCTWDDPIIIGPGFLSNSSKYKYFLKGERKFNQTHIPNGQFTDDGKVFEFPNLSINNY